MKIYPQLACSLAFSILIGILQHTSHFLFTQTENMDHFTHNARFTKRQGSRYENLLPRRLRKVFPASTETI